MTICPLLGYLLSVLILTSLVHTVTVSVILYGFLEAVLMNQSVIYFLYPTFLKEVFFFLHIIIDSPSSHFPSPSPTPLPIHSSKGDKASLE